MATQLKMQQIWNPLCKTHNYIIFKASQNRLTRMMNCTILFFQFELSDAQSQSLDELNQNNDQQDQPELEEVQAQEIQQESKSEEAQDIQQEEKSETENAEEIEYDLDGNVINSPANKQQNLLNQTPAIVGTPSSEQQDSPQEEEQESPSNDQDAPAEQKDEAPSSQLVEATNQEKNLLANDSDHAVPQQEEKSEPQVEEKKQETNEKQLEEEPTDEEELQNNDCIVVYSKCNFKGDSMKACDDLAEMKNFKHVIHSIFIPSGFSVTLYDKSNFQGSKHVFSESQKCLMNGIMMTQLQFFESSRLSGNLRRLG